MPAIEESKPLPMSQDKPLETAKPWVTNFLAIASAVGILANAIALLFTIIWAKAFITEGPGATLSRLEMGALYIFFVLWPIGALVLLGLLAASIVGIAQKGKPRSWAIATYSLTSGFILQLALQAFLLFYH
jgi:hypothetical protein